MNTEKMREGLEKWLDSETNNNAGVAYYVDAATGKYIHSDIELAWRAWQAARAGGDGEAVAWIIEDGASVKNICTDPDSVKTARRFNWGVIPLYTRPPAPAAKVPDKLTVSQCVHSQCAKGWNDCIDALSAAPTPEGGE